MHCNRSPASATTGSRLPIDGGECARPLLLPRPWMDVVAANVQRNLQVALAPGALHVCEQVCLIGDALFVLGTIRRPDGSEIDLPYWHQVVSRVN